MSFAELIAAADDAGAAAVREVLKLTLAEAPDAEEGVSYGVAALRYLGRPLVGVGANAKGFSIFPFSPAVVAAVASDLPDFTITKGSIGFNGERPIPRPVLTRIVRLRLAEIEPSPR